MPTSYINPSPSGETEGGRFSIIIPHKGPQWLLDRCVASVPQRDNLQIIVIHDEEGRGAGWARNQGLSKAEGSYVIFADSDDYFHPCFNDFLAFHFICFTYIAKQFRLTGTGPARQ